jgi:hypothetical protein
MTWLGGQGLFGPSSRAGHRLVYSWFLKKDIRIKMPDSVPAASPPPSRASSRRRHDRRRHHHLRHLRRHPPA